MTVDVDIDAQTDLWGLTVGDLQSNIVIGSNDISGTLKYVADYSSAFGSGEDSGNYLALHSTVPDVDGATITVEVVGGYHGPVTLDSDGISVVRIANKDSQTIRVVASKAGFDSVTREFSLTELVCNQS